MNLIESKGGLDFEYAFKKFLKPIVVLFVQATIICILMSFRLETNILAAATLVMTWLICYNAQWGKTEILRNEKRICI